MKMAFLISIFTINCQRIIPVLMIFLIFKKSMKVLDDRI